jgi:katanin p60 ATPase-containing subunit A1
VGDQAGERPRQEQRYNSGSTFPLGEGAVKGGEGAIYLWAKLPEQYVDDDKVVRWLATRHGVVVIPGGACGCPGHLRLSLFGRPDRE